MNTDKYPRGWNEARVRRVLEYYESQSDDEAAAEIEASLDSTTMEVPRALVPAVRELIAKRKAARTKKTHNTAMEPTNGAAWDRRSEEASRAVCGSSHSR